MTDRNQKFDVRGVFLAMPAMAFLVLYMASQQFTIWDQAIAVIFVALLAYGTLSLQQQQRREQLQRMEARNRQRDERR
jgi:hypothetical protein